MGNRAELAQKFLDAQRSRDAAAIDAVAAALADEAELVTPRGGVTGKDAIIERLKNPPQGRGGGGGGGMMGEITFGEPIEEGATVKIEAQIPPNPMLQGMSYVFGFNDKDQISKIETVIKR